MTTILAPARRDRIERLLASWMDWVPVPSQRLGAVDQAQAVEYAQERRDPESRGARMRGIICHRCQKDYTISEGRLCDGCASELAKLNEREIARLDLQERVRAGEADRDELTRILAVKRAHYASGSYAELEAAMRILRRRQPYSYWCLHRRYVDGIPFQVDKARLDAALRALSDLLPVELYVPGRPVTPDEERAGRDERIRRAAAAGASTRQLAGRFGVSQSLVMKILGRPAVTPDAA